MWRAFASLILLATLSLAQRPCAISPLSPEQEALAESAMGRAREALRDGRAEAMRAHVLAALALDPAHAEAWQLFLQDAGNDQDLLLQRSFEALMRLHGPQGLAATLPGPLKLLLQKDAELLKLSVTRAQALREVLELAKTLDKKQGSSAAQLLVARQLGEIASHLAGSSAAHLAVVAPAFAAFPEHPLIDLKGPLAALKECAESALAKKEPGRALYMARILQAIATQARLQGLKGPKPEGLQPVGMAATNLLGRARAALEAGAQITPLPDLEAMDPLGRQQFTSIHADPGNPGRTLSPTERYRVETTCGAETLLGAAQTVELHHARLVNWYGSDPFKERQGVLRLVPSSAELEAEGTPHWWAGGFQSGDVTTLKFSNGTIEGLGRGITHELTHRFDGALYPGMPAWLVEGRAVWTGAAYATSADENFVERHVSVGSVEAAFIKGYGNQSNLEKLIRGELDDYRDNYTAGYALFVFLRTAPPESTPLFASRLQHFMKTSASDRTPALERFVATFTDAEEKGGLPKDLKAFTKLFATWLQGFYWQSRAPFLEHYVTRTSSAWHAGYVYDKPTWHKARDRAEPFFAQDHAATLCDALLAEGRKKEAAQAAAVSALVDEFDPTRALAGAGLLASSGEHAAAWALQNSAARRFPTRVSPSEVPESLRSRLPKCHVLLKDLLASSNARAATLPRTSRVLHDHAQVLAALLGQPTPVLATALEQAAVESTAALPLGLAGWEETELSGYDEHRVKGLWSVLPDGLIVGRREERSGTGTTDRRAHQRDAFVRSAAALPPGAWRVSCRVQALTSFISGALVFGETRRDHHARLRFSCGDFMFSIGRKEEQSRVERVNVSFDGLFERENPLNSAVPGRDVKFAQPVADFRIEVLVDGGCATAFVNGELVGSYMRPDGAPLEGHIGFASGHGAFRVLEPQVEFLPHAARGAAAYVSPEAEGISGAPANRPVHGISTGPQGALMLWVPRPEAGSNAESGGLRVHEIMDGVSGLQALLSASKLTLPVTIVVPEDCSAERLKPLSDALATQKDAPRLVRHRWKKPLATVTVAEGTVLPVTALGWIDANGILRAIDPFDGRRNLWPRGVLQWLRGSGFVITEE